VRTRRRTEEGEKRERRVSREEGVRREDVGGGRE